MPERKKSLPQSVTEVIERVVKDLQSLVSDEPSDKPKRKSITDSVNIREGIEIFNVIYSTRFGRMPYLTLPDKLALGRLHGELSDFREVIATFLDMNDKWIVDNGHPPRLIPSRMNAIRTMMFDNKNNRREWA